MALEKRTADVAMAFGLDQSIDPHAEPQGALVLQNQRYTKEGALVRRPGYTRQTATPAMTGGYGLVKAGESIGVVTDTGIWPTGSGAPPTGRPPVTNRDTRVALTGTAGANVLSVDSAITTVSGVKYLVIAAVNWLETESNAGGAFATELWVWIYNYDTGELGLRQRVTSGAFSVSYARLITHANGEVSLVYAIQTSGSTGQILHKPVDVVGRALGITTQLSTTAYVYPPGDNAATCTFDVVRGRNNHIVLAWVSSSVKRPQVMSIDPLAVPLGAAVSAGGAVVAGIGCVAVVMTTGSSGSNQIVVAYMQEAADPTPMYFAWFTYAASIAYVSGALVTTQIFRVMTLFTNTTARMFLAFEVTTTGSNTPQQVLATAIGINADGSPSVSSLFFDGYEGFTLASKAQWLPSPIDRWVLALSPAYTDQNAFRAVWLMAIANATQQLTYPQPIATLSNEDARTPYNMQASVKGGPQFLPTSLNPVVAGSTSRLEIAFPSDLESNSALQSTPPATAYGSTYTELIRRWKVVESSARTAAVAGAGPAPSWTELNGIAYVCGSQLLQFDGATSMEAGFMTAPVAPFLGGGFSSTPPILAAGTYAYCVVFEETDGLGNIRVSAPSAIATTTITAGSPYVEITNNIPSYVPSGDANQPQRQFRAKLYRTQKNGSTFNLVWTCTIPPGQTVAYQESVPDTAAASAESLYTTGGVLESEPPPMLSQITTHRNRLIGVRSDTSAIAFTKEVTPPLAPQWSTDFQIRVDNDAGPPIAVASLDDKIVIFQADQILVSSGPGPDNLGDGGFTTPERIAVGVGVTPGQECSVCPMPLGIMFRHRSGYYLIDKSLQVQFIGDAVRDRVDALGTVQFARYMPSEQQVWIGGSGTRDLLVFDGRRGRWSTYLSNAYAGATCVAGAVERDGTVYFLSNVAGGLYALVPGQWIDIDGANLDYLEVIEVPWFRGSTGHGGMQRVWKIAITVAIENLTAQQLVLKTYTSREHQPYKSSDAPSDNTFTWIHNAPKPFALGHAVFVNHLRVQRCSGIKVRIEINNRTITGTLQTQYGLRLINVRYIYGVIGEGKSPNRPTVAAGA